MSNHVHLTNGNLTARTADTDPRPHVTPDWLKQAGHDTMAAGPASDTLAKRLASGQAMLSVVVPLLNESESLEKLYIRIKSAFAEFAPKHEIIFIDDGSKDTSFSILHKFWENDPAVSVLRFRRNLGKAAALSAGFDRVRGDVVAMMDADLQDQPEEFPRLIAKLDEGYDLVTGWKQKRHDPINKTLPSKLFNGTVSRYFKLEIHDFNCGLKIMRAPVAKNIRIYGDFHRFIPVLAAHQGYRVTECAIEHAPRMHGVSKYGAKRLITGMLDFMSSILVTKFYHKPLQMFGAIGLLSAMAGLMVGLYLLIGSLFGEGAHLRPLWMVMVLLILGGVQIVCTGLLAELMISSAHRKNSLYEVSEVLESAAVSSHLEPSPILGHSDAQAMGNHLTATA